MSCERCKELEAERDAARARAERNKTVCLEYADVISKLDYETGPENEMRVSTFDVEADPGAAYTRIKGKLEAEREAAHTAIDIARQEAALYKDRLRVVEEIGRKTEAERDAAMLALNQMADVIERGGAQAARDALRLFRSMRPQ